MTFSRDKFSPVACVASTFGFLVSGIADGETVVRHWNPDFMHGSKAAAQRHATKQFPCVHRVVPVDSFTSRTVGRSFWVHSLPRKDFARYATDYRNDIPGIGHEKTLAQKAT